jgi:hypothetical protein
LRVLGFEAFSEAWVRLKKVRRERNKKPTDHVLPDWCRKHPSIRNWINGLKISKFWSVGLAYDAFLPDSLIFGKRLKNQLLDGGEESKVCPFLFFKRVKN